MVGNEGSRRQVRMPLTRRGSTKLNAAEILARRDEHGAADGGEQLVRPIIRTPNSREQGRRGIRAEAEQDS